MLSFLRNLFAPKVSVVGYRGDALTFTCGRRLLVGREHGITASLPNGENIQMTVAVLAGQGENYKGRVVSPPLAINALVRCFPAPKDVPLSLHYKETPCAFTTHVRTFAIRSKDLPNYKATSAELSLEGTKAIVDGPMQVGQELTIELEVDHDEMATLKIRCQVGWCSQRDRTSHVAFLEFLDLEPDQAAQLGSYLASLKTGSVAAPEYRR